MTIKNVALIQQLVVVLHRLGTHDDYSSRAVIRQSIEKIRDLDRYSMSAGMADQYKAEALAARSALGFSVDAEDVSPSDITREIRKLNTTNR